MDIGYVKQIWDAACVLWGKVKTLPEIQTFSSQNTTFIEVMSKMFGFL